MKPVHEKIYELLKNGGKGRALDVACGKGTVGKALEGEGFEVFYADKYDRPEDAKLFVNTDLNLFLPFMGKSFDLVICSESLQYIDNHENIFREFNRVLKDGGNIVVSIPNILTISSRLYFLRRGYFSCFKPLRTKEKNKEWDHVVYNPVSFIEIFQLMKKNGFDIKRVAASDIRNKGWWLYPVIKALYGIGRIFDKRFDGKSCSNYEKSELIKWLSSGDILMGGHIIVCGVKVI